MAAVLAAAAVSPRQVAGVQRLARRRAGARVEQVVVRRAAARPAAYPGARGGHATSLEPDQDPGLARALGHRDRPGVPVGAATARSPPTLTMAEAAQLAGEGRGDEVGGERLAGGAEVERRAAPARGRRRLRCPIRSQDAGVGRRRRA